MKTKRETKQLENQTGYIRPTVEVMPVRVERGFAGSGETPDQMGTTTQPMGNQTWN